MPKNSLEHGTEDWARAQRIARTLDRVIDGSTGRVEAVMAAAGELRISRRQVYNLLARYEPERRVSGLLRKTGPRRKRLDPGAEAVIEETLRERWLVQEAPDLKSVVDEIRARCEERGLALPAYSTVTERRTRLFSDEEIAKKRSANAAHTRRLKARPGYIRAPAPLAVCQIDHTPTDMNFVEVIGEDEAFVGRASLTLLVDVFSRCILGFCLSLEKPQILTVALCLAQAICRKDAWLNAHGIAGEDWPIFGRPKQIVVDGGKEFQSEAFAHACAEFGIAIRRRNRGRVHEGGVVERLLGKVNRRLAQYPGRTGRSVADRDAYPAEQRACLSFRDLEQCVALAILDHNAEQNPKTLDVPIDRWRGAATGQDILRDDPLAVLLAFMPEMSRFLTAQGIACFALDYYDEWLGQLVPRRDRLGALLVKFDPRDISHVYVRHPDSGEFRPVGRRDKIRNPLTKWEHEAERDRLRRQHARSAVEKVRRRRQTETIVVEAQRRTKTERRDAVRSAHAAAAPKAHAAQEPPPSGPLAASARIKRRFPVEEL